MITIKKLKWSNLFSYGENNEIDFSSNPLTQIVGYNGHGKSSIALILEEALYNKNSKGIKKTDILNRNSKSKSYSIELEFSKDGDEYLLKTSRGTTQTIKLLKNSEDISSHTATGTYKTIEEIIGYDHKTFAQIVYQSSAASLEFLTATDSNRKKFLIDLLNLGKYVEAADIFKAAAKEVSDQLLVVNTNIKSANAWLAKYSTTDFSVKPILEVPEAPRHLIEEIFSLTESIKNINTHNKKIIQNNKYKELLDGIVLDPTVQAPTNAAEIASARTEKIEHTKAIKDAESLIQKMNKLGAHCPTCMQSVNPDIVADIVQNQLKIKTASEETIKDRDVAISEYEINLKSWQAELKNKELYELYHSLYDPSLDSELLTKKDIEDKIKELESQVDAVTAKIKAATAHNSLAVTHNATIEVIKTQMQEMHDELAVLKQEFDSLTARLNTLQILIKTFSSTGLVAYKIECLIKDLEEVSNKYLSELSAGRFQLSFKISASDKLNVVITDNGRDIDISALSGGERARVNTAALLGIRRLMQSLSNSRINLLILDETIENLDADGKEKLVEVLLAEEYLNTFIISHGFTHPLLEKVHVVKTKNISRIE